MAYTGEVSIKAVIEMKKENEKLQEVLHLLEMENFEYALKCNRMENILANIKAITQDHPKKLCETSEHIVDIIQTCNGVQGEVNNLPVPRENLLSKKTVTPPQENLPRCNKAHVVKPHMVNGTILYIPTINLTRVSDLSTRSKTETNSQHALENNSSVEGSSNLSDTAIPSTSGEGGSRSSNTVQDFSHEEISQVEEVSEASTSKSPSHSTVLSGTFQEVKIFLNQVSQESLDEESRKSVNARRRSKLSSSPRTKYRSGGRSRSGGISKCVTRSRPS